MGVGALLACEACSTDDPTVNRLPLDEPATAVPLQPAPVEPTPVEPTPVESAPEEPPVKMPPPPVSEPVFGGPPLHDRVALGDLELGRQVLELIGGDGSGTEGRCSSCHSITRANLSLWANLTRAFSSACLGDTSLDSQEHVDRTYGCLLEHASKGSDVEPSPDFFSPRTLGIYAAASHLPWFSYLFENASELRDGGDADDAYDHFISVAGMPPEGARLTQEEFGLLAEWFERDLPGMLELVPEGLGEPCVPGLDPGLASDLSLLAATGWRARNLETPLLMLGCAAGETGRACLSNFPNASETPRGAHWAEAVPGSSVRVLYDNTRNGVTSFWTRSSADGRYMASGANSGQFIDLASGRYIAADFAFDPTFFPDNSSFLVQGSSSGSDKSSGTLLCNQNVLDGRFNIITGEREGCSTPAGGVGLYQQVAVSLDGGDYWAVAGNFSSDDPEFGKWGQNPSAPFSANEGFVFTPVINLGNSFELGEDVFVPAPFQGDPMLSPSGKFVVTRTAGPETLDIDLTYGPFITSNQSGYSFYRVTTARAGSAWNVSLERAGQLCLDGGKATFSYDERWLILHHYVTAADATELGFESAKAPGFAEYAKLGAANLYLVDLRSGQATRITQMAPGQFALFPHFRSDGWIYFVMRSTDRTELFLASDAALRLEEAETRGK